MFGTVHVQYLEMESKGIYFAVPRTCVAKSVLQDCMNLRVVFSEVQHIPQWLIDRSAEEDSDFRLPSAMEQQPSTSDKETRRKSTGSFGVKRAPSPHVGTGVSPRQDCLPCDSGKRQKMSARSDSGRDSVMPTPLSESTSGSPGGGGGGGEQPISWQAASDKADCKCLVGGSPALAAQHALRTMGTTGTDQPCGACLYESGGRPPMQEDLGSYARRSLLAGSDMCTVGNLDEQTVDPLCQRCDAIALKDAAKNGLPKEAGIPIGTGIDCMVVLDDADERKDDDNDQRAKQEGGNRGMSLQQTQQEAKRLGGMANESFFEGTNADTNVTGLMEMQGKDAAAVRIQDMGENGSGTAKLNGCAKAEEADMQQRKCTSAGASSLRLVEDDQESEGKTLRKRKGRDTEDFNRKCPDARKGSGDPTLPNDRMVVIEDDDEVADGSPRRNENLAYGDDANRSLDMEDRALQDRGEGVHDSNARTDKIAALTPIPPHTVALMENALGVKREPEGFLMMPFSYSGKRQQEKTASIDLGSAAAAVAAAVAAAATAAAAAEAAAAEGIAEAREATCERLEHAEGDRVDSYSGKRQQEKTASIDLGSAAAAVAAAVAAAATAAAAAEAAAAEGIAEAREATCERLEHAEGDRVEYVEEKKRGRKPGVCRRERRQKTVVTDRWESTNEAEALSGSNFKEAKSKSGRKHCIYNCGKEYAARCGALRRHQRICPSNPNRFRAIVLYSPGHASSTSNKEDTKGCKQKATCPDIKGAALADGGGGLTATRRRQASLAPRTESQNDKVPGAELIAAPEQNSGKPVRSITALARGVNVMCAETTNPFPITMPLRVLSEC
ncbi:hypothetical protein CBR_g9132 [Chara braunii]|uniref:Uncharacterized protein n=1 Tax=Chara braunii TaxID=69332 RepID=A0A388KNU2_CHABU|nr:hypothetical protein CBR_g9132 [Chara braunii]|eukprot:GBG71721.1 hypothetical protein CBR_g9132 [Chara braunii]